MLAQVLESVGMEDEEDLDSCLYLQKPSCCLLGRLEKTLVHVSDKCKGPLCQAGGD